MAAFERGERSLDQATVLARKVPSWADAAATDLAKMLTISQLRRSIGPGGVVFTGSNGKQILSTGARPKPPGAPPSPPVRRYRHLSANAST